MEHAALGGFTANSRDRGCFKGESDAITLLGEGNVIGKYAALSDADGVVAICQLELEVPSEDEEEETGDRRRR